MDTHHPGIHINKHKMKPDEVLKLKNNLVDDSLYIGGTDGTERVTHENTGGKQARSKKIFLALGR